eukprot:CAMPEP_0198644210 /NCGR_PEP_ID=MMETSP1467-20131203/469_1 /TAXON_ID=1462469 /ORGANISM="unid. sp., Strain CCMP2135" /LENGTH=448 /DNA_ID=CAMNT_0044379657 /DNA_START=12 /DNA_END=1358 /DNA_ORIENTATION=+
MKAEAEPVFVEEEKEALVVKAETPPPGPKKKPSFCSPEIFLNRRVLCVCISTGTLMLGLGVTNPIIPALVKQLNASASVVGVAFSTFGASRLLLNIPIGWAADALGRKPVLVFGSALTALGATLSAFAPDKTTFVLTRAIAGAGNSCYLGTAMAYLADAATPQTRARFIGANQFAILIGVSFGPYLGGLCAKEYGLREPFLLVGALSALAALSTLLLLPSAPSTTTEKKPTTTTSSSSSEDVGAVLRTIVTDLRFVGAGAAHFCVFSMRQGGRNLVVAYICADQFGYEPKDLGALYAAMSLADLFLLGPAATLSDFVPDRRFVAVPSLLASAFSIAAVSVVAQARSHALLVLSLALWAFSTGLIGPTLPAYVADVAPTGHRGLAISLFRSCGDLGTLVAPVALGFILDHAGPSNAALALAVTVLFAAAFFAKFGIVPTHEKNLPHRQT